MPGFGMCIQMVTQVNGVGDVDRTHFGWLLLQYPKLFVQDKRYLILLDLSEKHRFCCTLRVPYWIVIWPWCNSFPPLLKPPP